MHQLLGERLGGGAGEGRYVACGPALSIGEGDRDVPPTPDEAALLENAVRWAAGG